MKTNWVHAEQRVAVGCLSCYNEGRLTFKWMNADELEAAYEVGLVKSVCDKATCGDEWEIQDYDGDIGRLRLGGWPNIENLIQMMRLMDDDPTRYVPAYEAACDRYESPTADEVEEVADMMMYVGEQSLADYFMEQAYDIGFVKNGDVMESYIDWEHYARDCMYDYSQFDYGGDTYLLPNY